MGHRTAAAPISPAMRVDGRLLAGVSGVVISPAMQALVAGFQVLSNLQYYSAMDE